MKKHWRAILIVVAVLSFGIAFSYPILYRMAEQKNNDTMQELAAMRESVLQEEREKQSHEPSAGVSADGSLAGANNTGAPVIATGDAQAGTTADSPAGNEQSGTASNPSAADTQNVAAADPSAVISQSGTTEDSQSGTAASPSAVNSQSGTTADSSAADSQSGIATADSQIGSAAGLSEVGAQSGYSSGSEQGDLRNGDSSDSLTGSVGTESPTASDEAASAGKVNNTGAVYDRFQTGTGGGTASGNGESVNNADTAGSAAQTNDTAGAGTASVSSGNNGNAGSTATETIEDYLLDYVPGLTWKQVSIPEYEGAAAPVLLSTRKQVEDWKYRESATPYPEKEKTELDEEKILPELKAIYARNNDLVGWIKIDGTIVDYPVIQSEDSEFYLDHDFDREENVNGQIILDPKCDPYTPSYNLVVSGHHMNNGSMFGGLPQYRDYSYWEERKIVEFDNLMERRQYVIFAAFYSADYDEYEEGFRYNADIQYKIDAVQWLEEVRENQIYDTGIDAQFGDEFVTLTTCDRSRRQDGRFVLVCRKIREGEEIE